MTSTAALASAKQIAPSSGSGSFMDAFLSADFHSWGFAARSPRTMTLGFPDAQGPTARFVWERHEETRATFGLAP